MKICVIGAGSPYTSEIVERLAQMQETLPVKEIMLMDIDERRLDIIHGFCQRFAAKLGLDAAITKTTDRKKAIKGAEFINTQIRVGGNSARANDEKIPLSMGFLGQETTGAGGLAKGLRTIPAMLDIARDVEELSPQAWIINYTNPSGLVAEAVTRYTHAKIVGLCAGGMQPRQWTAGALKVRPEDVRYNFAGLNHMNFAYNITVHDHLLTPEEFKLVTEYIADTAGQRGYVDKELMMKLGVLPSSYLQYYFHTEKKLEELRKAPLTRGEVVLELEKEFFKDFANPNIDTKPESLKKRGGTGYSELATMVMDAIHNNRDTWVVANTTNRGIFPLLPGEAVIETPCMINAAGVMPIAQEPPPKAVWGLIAAVKNYEMLAVEAAATGSRDMALLALLAHPLTGDYAISKKLLDKLLEVNKEYLPYFFK